jgi:hypothetical protein
MGHTAKTADRLLIKPANGRQAGTDQTHADRSPERHPKPRGQSDTESHASMAGISLATAPDGTTHHSHSQTP